MNARYIDWIWHIRGCVPLAPEQSVDKAFSRLEPLFRQFGTTHDLTDETLTFHKKDAASQDKMSIFDSGVLTVEHNAAGRMLRYNLSSRALLFCFLAPLMFLAFAQATKALARYEKQQDALAAKSKNASSAKKAPDKKQVAPLNPIDKFLGAPAPKPKDGKKDEDGGEDGGGKKPSPTPAYVFAGIFATLYVIGRLLESRLIKNLFRRTLL